MFAETYSCENLRVLSEEYICSHFRHVVKADEFVHLSSKLLVQFLHSENLQVSYYMVCVSGFNVRLLIYFVFPDLLCILDCF